MGNVDDSWEVIFLLEVRGPVMLSILLLAGRRQSQDRSLNSEEPFPATPGNKDLNVSQVDKDSSASL